MQQNKMTGFKHFFKTAAILSTAWLVAPSFALADIAVTPTEKPLEEVLISIRNYFLGAVIIACVFMIIWGGFNIATSGGDEKKMETGRKTLYGAVIGLIIALLAVAIVSLVRGAVEG